MNINLYQKNLEMGEIGEFRIVKKYAPQTHLYYYCFEELVSKSLVENKWETIRTFYWLEQIPEEYKHLIITADDYLNT